MPLYEYECQQCHRRTEKIQKFSDPEITICPYCAGPLERTITAAAVSFKGGGWYKDGYGSAKPAASGEAKSSDAKSSDSGSSSPDNSSAAPAQTKSENSTPAPAAAPAAAPSSTPAKS
ncbi:MAG: FmdB family zinc ribbon protein [Acidobacteriota bacterium]